MTLEEALGTGWMRAVHPEDREWVARENIEAKNAGRLFEAEYRFVDRNGNIYWMLDRMVPIQDETEHVLRLWYAGSIHNTASR